VKKTTGRARTNINDLAPAAGAFGDEHLAMVVGGMICKEGWKETSTATLNTNGGSDSQTDCTT